MNATVTLPLKEFDELREAKSKADNQLTKLNRAAKELEVFISFISTREHIAEYVDEFNRQSQTSRITIDAGRAKIIFKDGSEKN